MASKTQNLYLLRKVNIYPSLETLKRIAGLTEFKKLNENKAVLFLIEKGYNSLSEIEKKSIDDCYNKNAMRGKVIDRTKKKIDEYTKHFL